MSLGRDSSMKRVIQRKPALQRDPGVKPIQRKPAASRTARDGKGRFRGGKATG